jgi:glycosyltransferase involved in cell wall biosynthesis
MRVASISETDIGGAGLSALKLHNEFLNQGVDSTFYVNRKFSTLNSIVEIPNRKNNHKSPFGIGQYRSTEIDSQFTTGFSCKDEEFLEDIWKANDIILLRWSSIVVSDLVVSKWSHKTKPVVWCLSDMAPLTGGCHYSMGCDGYQTSCSPCKKLPIELNMIPEMVFKRRRRLWRNITFVSPSQWLADIARNSAIGRNNDIRVIQTGVELSIFKNYDRRSQKKRLGLNTEKPTILFGANSLKDPRKGFKYLPELVDILNDNYGLSKKYSVLFVGSGSTDLDALHCDVNVLGHIDSREKLATIYSAADVTVLPYVEDNLPNFCLESLACGVPVVSFAIGGFIDVIHPMKNGELARPYDAWDLAYRLVNILNLKLDPCRIRNFAEHNLDISVQAKSYINLFYELLLEKQTSVTFSYN